MGIDFGHAFGTATQFLMIPELMPFRLTPQLLGVMAPDLAPDGRACGYLKHTMVHVLAALQHSRALLLDALDVFVQDPILNWDSFINKMATRRHRRGPADQQQPAPVNAASEHAARRWFPQEKLAVVRRKLCLGSPGRITADEVEHSVQTANPTLCRKIAAVAAGDPLRDLRGRVGTTCASVIVCVSLHCTNPWILLLTACCLCFCNKNNRNKSSVSWNKQQTRTSWRSHTRVGQVGHKKKTKMMR